MEFHGPKLSSGGGLLLFRELDEVLGLHELAAAHLQYTRRGKNGIQTFSGLLRQSALGRLAGYLHAFEVGSQAKAGIGKWLAYYNTERPHSTHGILTPD
jgi:transposase InsO family protein